MSEPNALNEQNSLLVVAKHCHRLNGRGSPAQSPTSMPIQGMSMTD